MAAVFVDTLCEGPACRTDPGEVSSLCVGLLSVRSTIRTLSLVLSRQLCVHLHQRNESKSQTCINRLLSPAVHSMGSVFTMLKTRVQKTFLAETVVSSFKLVDISK